ncbi:unnamed protein product, partial [Staurois parvus]
MYVKWFSTVMEYYVILFYNFQISRQFRPLTSRRRRERNPDDRCRNRPEDIAGDAAGGT